ncbi:MAG: cold shock domain-containing protein [Actinomycetia bacterium]|nr:cold shock domain-containing protein [Actinomycetes bacterium]
MQGVVKTYDPQTGIGVIICDDDRSAVLLRPGSLQGSIFRFLRQGQRIVFETEREGEHSFAHTVRMGQDGY